MPTKEQIPKPHYLVVNADESEPGSFKDNEILSRVPHRFIEGCLITAHAVDSTNVFVYIRGEYTGPYEILVAALEELKDRPEIRGDVTIVVHRGAGAYICGEETALIESLEGKRGQPRSKPPFPAISGLYASPTVVNNVETMATVPPILELGGAEYAKLGVENSRGTRVVSVSGHVANGGNYEIEPGISLRDLIYAEHLGGGVPGGRKLKAVIPGGSSTVILRGDEIDVGYDFDSLLQLRTAMGSAGVICLDERVCMVQLGIRVSEFYEHESCGKCTPCREGTRWMTAILRKLEAGDATRARARPAARRLRPHQRQVPVPARRDGRGGRRELRREVPRRVRRAHRRGRLPVRRQLAARPGPGAGRARIALHLGRSQAARTCDAQVNGLQVYERHFRPPWPRRQTMVSNATIHRCRDRLAELVTVTIDERQVQVPKGTGMVETAAAAGIEIPVFCYEPRLGPPVGACRMCLVEVEGMPKLQAGCTLTAVDGMVVKTARSSAQAAEGQNATLEFILVNHPLDCPVCDKGGECPLQDLTFRYGPGNTRMTFPKRTMEKPIPISPLIALDRERCILCYRCTRFSESVAEDGQLVAINRGADSVIATFEDEPYKGHFSGNVTEICPVGALTSTQYRFEARPWEIQNVPSVCGMCPVGCNVSVTTREGKVKRIQSRNHPEIDEGWLCDKGRFAYAHLDAPDRITTPLRKAGPRRFEAISWDDAIDHAAELLRAGGATTVTALSGGESVEEAYALAKLMRRGLGAHNAVLTEEPSGVRRLAALCAPRPRSRSPSLCDVPVVERAPIVDLWLKAARRAGATISYEPPDRAPSTRSSPTTRQRRARRRDARLRTAVHAERPRRRRRLERGRRRDPVDDKPRVLLISGDEAATERGRARDGRRGRDRDRHRPLRGELPQLRRPRPSRHELPGARRHDRQPRRAAAAPAPRRARARSRRARLALEARRALRRRDLAARLGRLRRDLRALLRRRHFRRPRRARPAPAARGAPDAAPYPRVPTRQRQRAAADRVQAALLRRRGRPHARAAVPAARRRGRALAGGRASSAASATAPPSPSPRTARRSSCARGSPATWRPARSASRRSTRPACTRPST